MVLSNDYAPPQELPTPIVPVTPSPVPTDDQMSATIISVDAKAEVKEAADEKEGEQPHWLLSRRITA